MLPAGCLGGWSLLAAVAADTIYSDPLWTHFLQSLSTLCMQTTVCISATHLSCLLDNTGPQASYMSNLLFCGLVCELSAF